MTPGNIFMLSSFSWEVSHLLIYLAWGGHMCATAVWMEVRVLFWESVLFLYQVGSWDLTQAVRLGGQCLHRRRHLPGSVVKICNAYILYVHVYILPSPMSWGWKWTQGFVHTVEAFDHRLGRLRPFLSFFLFVFQRRSCRIDLIVLEYTMALLLTATLLPLTAGITNTCHHALFL